MTVPAIDVFGARFRNPVVLAAGTAGFGREVDRVIALSALGGLATKAVSLEPRAGHAAPRVAEMPGAMLNAVGLANPGLEVVRREHLPWLREHHPDLRVLVNVVGHRAADYAAVVRGLAQTPGITAFELNVSCPNVERGGLEFGAEAATLAALVGLARAETDRPLLVKLSPAVEDPAAIAAAAVTAGADGFTCVNTLPSRLVEGAAQHASRLGHGSGGVSGPRLLAVGVRVTEAVHRTTGRPVIGAGGILTGRDAVAYLRAGATLVAVGTAALADPRAPERIAREIAVLLGRPDDAAA